MIRKIFIYFFIIQLTLLLIIFYIVLRNSNILKKNVTLIVEPYEYNRYVELKYNQLNILKNIAFNYIKNEQKNIISNYKNQLEKENIELIKFLYELNYQKVKTTKILNHYIHKNNINITITNKDKKVIVNKNIKTLNTKILLPCIPSTQHKKCFIIKNNIFYNVLYEPTYKLYFINQKKFDQKIFEKIKLDSIKKVLIYIPNILIFYNKHLIKGKFDTNHFYIFSKLYDNYFLGVSLSYNKAFELSHKLNKYLVNKIAKTREKIILSFIIISIINYIIFIIFYKNKIYIIDEIYDEYKEMAFKDKLLKNVYNRDGFNINYNLKKYSTLLIADLDNFKYINDTFGHKRGDKILIDFGWYLNEYFSDDLIGRWGGDEFLIATNKNPEYIKKIFNEIKEQLLLKQKQFDKKLTKKLTLSVGGCKKENLVFEEKFEKADLALYKAKRLGKGKVLFFDEIDYIKI